MTTVVCPNCERDTGVPKERVSSSTVPPIPIPDVMLIALLVAEGHRCNTENVATRQIADFVKDA